MVIDDTLMGRRLDEYRLDDLLGQGGMARVYRGLDVRLKRWVAIKVIDKPFRADQDYSRRFEREAQAMAQLEHPNIVKLYHYGEADGLLYMVLQYIEGLALDQLLASYRQDGAFIEPEEASRITREIGSALDYAHGRGVIHRDVKPANIILNQQGNAILVDFGLVLLADTGTRNEAFGTPDYIAPEQARSSFNVVPQSDLYALGVILYEMFTGTLPFEAKEPLDVAMLHMTEPPPPPREVRPDLDPAVERVILKALAKEPGQRYASGMALADALDQALGTASAARSVSPPPTLSHLSIPERVRVELAENPLPPLPAAALRLPPELAETAPVSARFGPQEKVDQTGNGTGPRPALESTKPAGVSLFWPIFVGLAAGLAILASLVVGIVGVMVVSRQLQGSATDQGENFAPLETPLLSSLETPTPFPSATLLPPPATPTPPPIPQLVADTQRDFSSSPGGIWEYLWSDDDDNDFEPMQFEERKYGACWYAKDYVRICPASGHPGKDKGIAWRWRSNFTGHVTILVSIRKIDVGGDGVVMIVYYNGQAVQGLQLDPADTQGISGKNLFEMDVKEGDQITFVMKKKGRDEYDHTAFQAQIYRQ
ncbi:MAG: serine/threonine-protein kinase [Chloroflexota bacterium]